MVKIEKVVQRSETKTLCRMKSEKSYEEVKVKSERVVQKGENSPSKRVKY